ncbi:MAG: glycosyltransferase [Candidatus Omnitrophica bacterium]|nr:glycosyltransferase [Candidatus Omnitrophota bacterium]
MDGFSVIVTAYNEPEELKVCLESLKKNSSLPNEVLVLINPQPKGEHDPRVVEVARQFPEVRLILNETDVGCYGSWNKGARLAKREILCFMNADQYMAPRWDASLLAHHTRKNILTSQLVESGIFSSYHACLVRNFGAGAKEFDEKGFLEYVRGHEENRLAMDGAFIPTVIDRKLFLRLGGWPNKRPFPYPNDRIFRKRVLWKRGMEYQRVMNSFSYHFQHASFDRDLDGKLYFERKETPDRNVVIEGRLGRLKTKIVRKMIRLGLKKRRVYGWYRPKRIDLQLAHRYCIGRGVEVGPGENRFPHLNAISVDLYIGFKDRIYPPPDILGTAYDLSFFADESRDFVFSSHLLERLYNPLRALKEWRRVLKPGGVLFSIVSDKRYVQNPVENRVPETLLEELLGREQQGLVETNDTQGRLFSYWTPRSFIAMLEHVGFHPIEVWEAPQKNIGLDIRPLNWNDFTIVAKTKSTH